MSAPDLWRSVEAVHDVVYFAPDVREHFESVGLRGFWMAYTASRSAALGTPGPEVVVAAFHGFAPGLIARAVPAAWQFSTPDAVLDARLALARRQLGSVIADDAGTAALADRLVDLAMAADLGGKVLAAAHRALPVPPDAIGRLWWAATVLRELRGDAHVAVLVSAGIDGVMANVWGVAAGLVPERQREVRGWSEKEWSAAASRLTALGWLSDGAPTALGHGERSRIEQLTDDACAAALARGDDAAEVSPELSELARRVAAAGLVGYPNPTGVGAP